MALRMRENVAGSAAYDNRLADAIAQRGLSWTDLCGDAVYPLPTASAYLRAAFVAAVLRLAEDTLQGRVVVADSDAVVAVRSAGVLLDRWMLRDRGSILSGVHAAVQAGVELLRLLWHARACMRLALAAGDGHEALVSAPSRWHAARERGLLLFGVPVGEYRQSMAVSAMSKLERCWLRTAPNREVCAYAAALQLRAAQMCVLLDEAHGALDMARMSEVVEAPAQDESFRVATPLMMEECERLFYGVSFTAAVHAWLTQVAPLESYVPSAAARARLFAMLHEALLPSAMFVTTITDEFVSNGIDGHALMGELERFHVTNSTAEQETAASAMQRFRPQEYGLAQEALAGKSLRDDIVAPYAARYTERPPAHGVLDDAALNFRGLAIVVLHMLMSFETRGATLLDSFFVDATDLQPVDALGTFAFVPNASVREHTHRRAAPCVVAVQSAYYVVVFGADAATPGAGWLRPGDRVIECLDVADAFLMWVAAVCEDPVLGGDLGFGGPPRDMRTLYRRLWGRAAPHRWPSERAADARRAEEERQMRDAVRDGIVM